MLSILHVWLQTKNPPPATVVHWSKFNNGLSGAGGGAQPTPEVSHSYKSHFKPSCDNSGCVVGQASVQTAEGPGPSSLAH